MASIQFQTKNGTPSASAHLSTTNSSGRSFSGRDSGTTEHDPHTQSQPSSSTPPSTTSLLESLSQDGFVRIPSFLPRHLLHALQAACVHLTNLARQGGWPYVRTVPKQYPPWQPWKEGDNIWGIQHLLHPDMKEDVREVLAEVYFSEEVMSVVKQLLQPSVVVSASSPTSTTSSTTTNPKDEIATSTVSDDDLVMELFNLLVSPSDSVDFALAWHRDDIRPEVTAQEEARLLSEKSPNGRQLHAQYNIALFDDESLIVIPGSHRRVRTDVERRATLGRQSTNNSKLKTDTPPPLTSTNAPPSTALTKDESGNKGMDVDEGTDTAETSLDQSLDLPGQLVVKMKPGDAVFYDSNILHRGVYTGIPTATATTALLPTSTDATADDKIGRMTLHGSVGLAGHGTERARQVLQHAVGEWIERPDAAFSKIENKKKRDRAEGMRKRLIAMGREQQRETLGYSLEG